jgi:hypothetical protein
MIGILAMDPNRCPPRLCLTRCGPAESAPKRGWVREGLPGKDSQGRLGEGGRREDSLEWAVGEDDQGRRSTAGGTSVAAAASGADVASGTDLPSAGDRMGRDLRKSGRTGCSV